MVCSRPAHRSSPEHQAVLVPIILLETKLVVVSLIHVAADILVGLGLSLLHEETIRSEVFAFQQVNPSRRTGLGRVIFAWDDWLLFLISIS